MTQTFSFGTQGQANITQPDPNGEKLIVKSSENEISVIDVRITGDVSSTPTNDTVSTNASDDRIETESFYAFETLNGITLSEPATGDITVMGQGDAATGEVRVNSVPADADTIRIDLGSLTDFTYTFRAPGRRTIQTLATAAISQGDFFDITVEGFAQRFWFDIDNAGTGAPSTPAGGTRNEVDIATGDTAAQVATKLQTRIAATISAKIASGVLSDVITITGVKLGVVSTTDGSAPTGFTFTQITAGTADLPFQVRTLYNSDGSVSDAEDIADNLNRAIGVSGTESVNYGNATNAHAYVNAVVNAEVVSLTDKVACNRQLGWNIVQTVGATLTIIPMVGGANGVTLATLPAGTTEYYDGFDLDTPDLSTGTLPALLKPTSDAIQVGSNDIELHVKMENATPIIWHLEWTDDPSLDNWAVVAETDPSITTDDKPADDPYILQIESVRPEHIRLVIEDNNNAVALKLDFRVNFRT